MSDHYQRVKEYLQELEMNITHEDEKEELYMVQDEDRGIINLVIDCEDPILVFEQLIMEVNSEDAGVLCRLLQMNRTLVHGAFVLDEDGKRVFFRDTLQLENLDLNEVEGTINSLELALAEYGSELIRFSRAGKA
ncbi:MAG: molecular chaperone Tir [Candidatus Aminicenantes bacterium]|nr:molecular chaperone Tir [Candidatus Aminicenantes bacterium]NIM83627.1 molecular chaperone Tir [Candidatus Aminicenantes bacterium]NIN23030.1 molecular chaperone Tir [Candidatus Aminicenantes bacterium]NIN46766.1 molecular chaperone Tir [Candidatus Aminicenantes bacterium]NIN89679.1 molecular chaperone Tir [Candidatus Aminicenantes bacterium]